MKAYSNVLTILSIAGIALTVGACGGGGSNNSSAAGTAVTTSTCVYTQVGYLPQGSCQAGYGQVIVASSGYTAGQCIPSNGATNGVYNNGYNNGVYNNGGYNNGVYNNGVYNNGVYGNTGYGTTGLDGGQCSSQNGVNGVNNGQCIQTPSLGCLPQCTVPGTGALGLSYNGNCAPATTFGVYSNNGVGIPNGGVIPPYGYGPYAPGYGVYPGGYIPGGGGNFGGFYYYRGI